MMGPPPHPHPHPPAGTNPNANPSQNPSDLNSNVYNDTTCTSGTSSGEVAPPPPPPSNGINGGTSSISNNPPPSHPQRMPPHGAPQVVPLRQFMTPGPTPAGRPNGGSVGSARSGRYSGSAMKTPSRAWTDVEVSIGIGIGIFDWGFGSKYFD